MAADGYLGSGVVWKYETVLSIFFLLQYIGTYAYKYKQCWGPLPQNKVLKWESQLTGSLPCKLTLAISSCMANQLYDF